MIKIGEYNKLKVLRKSDLGYMLSNGSEEVLMHFKQSLRELKDGEEVEVFIYSDKQRRPTASMIKPTATVLEAGFGKVVLVESGVGVFVNINTPKDVLISKDYLPYDETLWPAIDDLVLVRLKLKHDILVAKPLNRFEIIEIKKDVNYAELERVNGRVCHIALKGIGILTNDFNYVFVPNNQFRGKYRMGEEVTVTITKALENDYYGMLNAYKEELVDTDINTILEYLDNHGGIMKLTAKSSSEDIAKVFNMSRKAFKRAYGSLYKDRIIDFDSEKTFKVKK